MPVRLRIAVHGTRNARIFHIVASHAGKARNAKPLETLGIYNPRADPLTNEKTVEWSVERIRYWLGVGAQPSDTVLSLLERGGVVPRAPKPWDPKPKFEPTSYYPAETEAHKEAVARAENPELYNVFAHRPEKNPRKKQLEITRQWTHDRHLLEKGAKGGVPKTVKLDRNQLANVAREEAARKAQAAGDDMQPPPPPPEQAGGQESATV